MTVLFSTTYNGRSRFDETVLLPTSVTGNLLHLVCLLLMGQVPVHSAGRGAAMAIPMAMLSSPPWACKCLTAPPAQSFENLVPGAGCASD